MFFFFSSRRRHTRLQGDWSSDVCSSDLPERRPAPFWVPRQDDSSTAALRAFSWLLARPLPLTPQSLDPAGPAAPIILSDADWPREPTGVFLAALVLFR